MRYEENKKLYKFTYLEDDELYTNWVWLEDDEVSQYKSESSSIKCRVATQEEADLYSEAYEDGYGIAAIIEFNSTYNGITYRVELSEGGELDHSTKMFQCSICNKHKDFDTEVATSRGYYLTELVDDVLWHVCYDCVALGDAIDVIEFAPEA